MTTTIDLPSGESPTPHTSFPAIQSPHPSGSERLRESARAVQMAVGLAVSRTRERCERTAELITVVRAKQAAVEAAAADDRTPR